MSSPRPFLPWPDKRLTQVAAPVAAVDDGIRGIWDEMLAAMYAMPGIGLAAVQLGEMQRLAVLDCSERGDQPVRLANPRLVQASVELRARYEASPNLPGVGAEVKRPAQVRVAYLDETGASVERDFTGDWATSVQHQIDHLDGKLYIHRLSPMKRRMLLAKYDKARKRG